MNQKKIPVNQFSQPDFQYNSIRSISKNVPSLGNFPKCVTNGIRTRISFMTTSNIFVNFDTCFKLTDIMLRCIVHRINPFYTLKFKKRSDRKHFVSCLYFLRIICGQKVFLSLFTIYGILGTCQINTVVPVMDVFFYQSDLLDAHIFPVVMIIFVFIFTFGI